MPIGKKYEPPPSPPQNTAKRIYRLKVVQRAPSTPNGWIVIPPKPRDAEKFRDKSKQLTCIRHDDHGQYFVDECVERTDIVIGDSLPEDRRFMTHISCPKFQFQVSIAACHRYCSYPCSEHVRVIQENGWYRRGGKPMFAVKSDRRGASSTPTHDKKPRKKNADNTDDDI